MSDSSAYAGWQLLVLFEILAEPKTRSSHIKTSNVKILIISDLDRYVVVLDENLSDVVYPSTTANMRCSFDVSQLTLCDERRSGGEHDNQLTICARYLNRIARSSNEFSYA